MKYYQINIDGKNKTDHYKSVRTAKVMILQYITGAFGNSNDFKEQEHKASVMEVYKDKYSILNDGRFTEVFNASGNIGSITAKIAMTI